MVRFEIEFTPMVTGFLTGAAIFLFQRLLTGRMNKESAKGEEEEAATLDDAQETRPPPCEPSPEPSIEPAEAERPRGRPLDSRELRFRVRAGLALAVLSFGLLFATVVFWDLSGDASGRREMLAPVAATVLAVATESQAAEPLLENLAIATAALTLDSADAELALAPGRAEAAHSTESTTPTADASDELRAVPELAAAAEAVHGRDLDDGFANSKVVTLNLTRQEMALEDVGSTIHVKSAYWSSITVGTPAVSFKVVFDTGSGHLILPSAYCHSSTCRAHKRYRRTKSTSARDINYDGELVEKGDPRDQITVSFGTGEVTGVFVEEAVCISKDSILPVPFDGDSEHYDGCIPLRMIMATQMSEDPFKTFQFDGVLGLGLPGLSQAPEFNFIHVVRNSLGQWGSTTPQIFAVFLAQHEYEHSEISLGGYMPERLEGKVAWNRVIHPQMGHWMLRIKGIKVDGQPLEFCRQGCRAVVDTGTSLLAVPTPAFPEVYELLRHEADPLLECKGKGPKLRIELDNFTVVLEPRDYARPQKSLPGAVAKKAPPRLPALPPDFGRNESVAPLPEICKPMLMTMDLPAPVGPKLFVFGEPVLRKYYTVYDTSESQPRIGFARARHRDEAEARAQAVPPVEAVVL